MNKTNKQNVSKKRKSKDKNERERRMNRWHGERTYVLKGGSVKEEEEVKVRNWEVGSGNVWRNVRVREKCCMEYRKKLIQNKIEHARQDKTRQNMTRQ